MQAMHRTQSMRGVVIVAALLAGAVAACSEKSTPTTPAPTINLTGTWSGNLTVLNNPVQMTWTLTQNDATNVTGPVTLGLSSGTVLLNGFLTGTLSGSSFNYTITVGPGGVPAQPNCAGQVGGTMAVTIGAVSTMTGSSAVTGSNCTPPFPGGTITLTKR
jgi:hypothetical protein